MSHKIRCSGILLGVLASTVLFVGCAKKHPMSAGEVAGNVDCRVCHTPKLAPNARDFSELYWVQKPHHPIGARYFPSDNGSSDYPRPTGEIANISFFDTNGNGQPDDDEVQLFGTKGVITVECASCHRPHGVAGLRKEAGDYLRTSNQESALCMVCHKV